MLAVIGGILIAYNATTSSEQVALNEVNDVVVESVRLDDVQTDSITESSSERKDEMSAGTYTMYNSNKLAMAEDGDVVLFFKASWCPSCRALDNDIKSDLSAVPSNLTILEVDYDSSQELRQKYGVTTQHTLVQVDANGELIKKWSGGNTLDSVVAQIN